MFKSSLQTPSLFRGALFGASLLLAGCYASTNLDNSDTFYQPDPESVAAGEVLYQAYCLECHGESLRGDGPRAASLEQQPADLTAQSIHFTQTAIKGVIDYPHYSKEAITDQIKYGSDIMPPLKEVLDSEQIGQLTDFVSTRIRNPD